MAPYSLNSPVVLLRRILLLLLLLLPLLPGDLFAGRPLITDDAWTQGRGKSLLEIGFDYATDNSDGVRVTKTLSSVELDYGIADPVDLNVSTAYQTLQINDKGDRSHPTGFVDTLLELKWRFYEDGKGLGMAVKPGLMLPTGNYPRGIESGDYRFGSGQVRPRLWLVASKEIRPFSFHLNLGYMRNYNRYDAQNDLWHASLAAEWRMGKKLRFVSNMGIDTNPEKGTTEDPAFVLGGFIYTLAEGIEGDFGVKRGLNEPGYDMTFTTGISIKF